MVFYKVLKIGKGNLHRCLLFSMSLYAWGLGKNGQLGQGTNDTHILPVKVLLPRHTHNYKSHKKESNTYNTNGAKSPSRSSEDNKVIDIAAGGLMTGFVTSNGEVFFCGSGLHGRLGTGDENERLHPVRISVPGDDKVVKVSI